MATGPAADRGVSAPALLLGKGMKFFAAPADQPRTRRATDVVLLVPALLGLALAIAAYPPDAVERSLEAFLRSVPSWLDPAWEFLSSLLWLWTGVLVLVSLVRARFVVVAQALAASVLAALVALCAARLATGDWPDEAGAFFGGAGAPRFPNAWIAETTAVVVTIAPHLARPVRLVGRWVLVLGVVGGAVVGGATPLGNVAAVLIALVAAATVRLASGTSAGRPGPQDVTNGLAQLGVEATAPEEAERQVAGVYHLRAADREGRPLLVKVYGRDAYDTQLVAKLWRRVWYRGGGVPIGLGRLQSAEHEAFVTLLVRNAGVATHEVVTAGATVDDDALLVLRGEAVPLAELSPDEIDDALLGRAWRALVLLGELRVAHQQVDPTTVALVSGEVGLVNFAGAAVAPDDAQLAADEAQLLMTTASLVGSERALEAAGKALGRERMVALLPYLQAAALGPPLRQALKAAAIDADAVREQAAAALGAEPPQLVNLRRVSWRSVVQLALLGVASYAIVTAATNVDWSEFSSTLDHASWGWVVFAFLVAQLPRVTQALATLGSVPAPLPFGPVYAMQLATGYMNVALPSNLARMAVNIRFFQRQGLSPATSVAAGAIDSFASTVVQAVLLVTLLVFAETSLALDLPFPSDGELTLLWIVAALVVVSVLALVLVRRIRSAISERVRRWWPEVRAALRGLRAKHKLALLVVGSVATELLFAAALGLFARSFGYDLTLAELLVINMSVALLGSVVPIPGNIGVAEFGLTIGLVSAGMSEEAALAAVLLYRISTYYLPPVWGFGAMLWLQRNRYL